MRRTHHRAARVDRPGGELQVLPTDPRPPGPGQVRVDVQAAGVCGADNGTVHDTDPGAGFPIIPGHEVAGTVAEVGEHVNDQLVGQRVAVGWFGGSCGHCHTCRAGDPVHCPERQVPGNSYPGGWATTITVPAMALARVPDQMPLTDAAPFGCAGVTMFNALTSAQIPAGGRVAVIGIGGLGHLGVQFAAAMGHETIAVGRGKGKRTVSTDLGAAAYIDSEEEPPGRALHRMGGAQLIVSTVPSGAMIDELVDGLAPHGQLTLLGMDGQEWSISPDKLVAHARSLSGHITGNPTETEAAMRFALTNGVRPMTETVPLDRAADALAEQQAGRARFRMVLTVDR